uniref:Uncharacterized protein n=1 Tax=Panagrolaimus superbus TaxID=310955 RepID=A0A914Z6G2_9BILA
MNKSSNISYFEAKIAEKQLYLESLKEAATKGGDLTSWCNGFIEHMDDLLDVLVFCKNKFQKKEQDAKLVVTGEPVITLSSSHNSPASTSSSTPTSPFSLVASSSSDNYSTPADPISSADYFALRDKENRCSILVMNLPECGAFEPSEKRASDLVDIKTMLKCSGISADIENVLRFSPKSLPADRAPFLKVVFKSEEEKKKVLSTVISSIRRIRSLDSKYVNVAVCDPDKSGKDRTNANFTRLNPSPTFQRNCDLSSFNQINAPSKFGGNYNNSPSAFNRTTVSPSFDLNFDSNTSSSPSPNHNAAIVPPTKSHVQKMFATSPRSHPPQVTRYTQPRGGNKDVYSSDEEK